MGLAASQARFLAITARKMNCEFQSMQIAQEKLSVTRDMEKASQDYQKALDASKLVWETPDGDVYDVTYAMMMTPSNFNDYNAYLITDNKGKIVLSPPMFDAALAAGMIDENGEPIGAFSESGRNSFLNELAARGQVSKTVSEQIQALGSLGYSKSGVGGEILDKTIANIMQTKSFIDYLKTATDKDGNLVYKAFDGFDDILKDKNGKSLSSELTYSESKLFDKNFLGKGKNYAISKGKNAENILAETELDKLTLGSILSGNYTFTVNMKGLSGDKNDTINAILRNMVNHFAGVFGYSDSAIESGKGMSLDPKLNEALGIAIELTFNDFKRVMDGKNRKTSDRYNATTKDGDCYSINLSNLLKSYLTNFTNALDGFSNGYGVNKESAKSVYVTDDLAHYFTIKNEESVSQQDQLNADFYNQMYNVICMYGACTDTVKQEMVTDQAYLNNALKNGQLFISSLNTDGYFYAGHYTLNGHVGEVADEDAIARAELDYEVTKSKLNSKEETLELKMKNLDMEISALSTEFETVKSMISKNVEKVFTMFSS